MEAKCAVHLEGTVPLDGVGSPVGGASRGWEGGGGGARVEADRSERDQLVNWCPVTIRMVLQKERERGRERGGRERERVLTESQ